MRILLVVLGLTAPFTFSQSCFAGDQSPPRPVPGIAGSPLTSGLPMLLHKLGVELMPRAHAAECTSEGETCTSNEQCCPGLECSGGPPATCVEED
ncbi:MAG: hypothetical protein JOY83_04575 [Alphaproteobacteria bacterium]|nr:hypothetical protein [Alphaproteobacteria bacterium]